MKSTIVTRSLLLGMLALAASAERLHAAETPKKSAPAIYDESADGSKQIVDALIAAKREHKHVLLQFGANWCGWCHLLHKLFETNKGISDELKADYVIVKIDVNKGHNKE